MINELYVYLMENDAAKIRNFEYRCTVYMWVKILAIRYFVKKRGRMIDTTSQESPYVRPEVSTDEEQKTVARNDVERLFEQMPTQRYAVVLRKLLIEDWEPERLAKAMDITTANLYNIKRRAMVQLTRVALKDIKEYGK
jgi:DNA-directed RNA polymerase specialized sigma24 family protein